MYYQTNKHIRCKIIIYYVNKRACMYVYIYINRSCLGHSIRGPAMLCKAPTTMPQERSAADLESEMLLVSRLIFFLTLSSNMQI